MSNKDTGAVTGKQDQHRGLAPKLRFPVFRNAGGWKTKPLHKLCQVNPPNAGLPESFVYIDLGSVEAGELITAKRISRDGAPSRAQRLLKKEDILFQTVRPYQKNNLLFDIDEDDVVASTGYAQLRSNGPNTYLYHVIHTDDFVRKVIEKCTGSNYPAINSSDLAGLLLPIPDSDEQQKIADCLSSIDKLIAIEADKLDTLKDQKKGLMQQLFPVPGETTPRRRFLEFQDAGEWQEKELGPNTRKVGSGITPKGGNAAYSSSGRPFMRSQNVGWGELILDNVAFIDEKLHATFPATEIQVGDVLLNITGASIGRSAIADHRISGGNVNQHVCIIRVTERKLTPAYLNQFLLSPGGQSQIDSFQAGGNRQGLNFEQIRSFEVPCPPTIDEQARIAGCLSSIDTLIAAQDDKVDALKAHKRGLMQQLFPVMDEVQA